MGSSCIANRLKKVLPKLISEDQTGFMSDRYMGDNIRLIYDMIQYLNFKNQPGMLLCLDFEKAFDSLDWKFMFKTLKAYGFGEDLCQWIATFYKDIKSTVIVNGQTTPWFEIKRGCRQGDPISSYIFILCAEILSLMIKENKDIKGITVGNVEHKISQFADDTQLMNKGDRESFEATFDTVDTFGKVSGLMTNTEKTQAVWLGSKKHSTIKYMPHLKIHWNPDKFKILGVWFTASLRECEKLNYDEKYAEIKMLFKIWMKRLITPLGRIAILKSLILSKLIHLWILLPNPPEHSVSELQKMCFKFVWKNKQDRISRKTAVQNVKLGGLGIPDLHTYIASLKLLWIRKIEFSTHKWTSIFESGSVTLNHLKKFGPNYACPKNIDNLFWRHVFLAYKQLFYKSKPTNSLELLAEPVFHNERIQVGGTVSKHVSWADKGVFCIGHFISEEGNYKSYVNFTNEYGIKTDFLTFCGLVSAIKKYVTRTSIHPTNNVAQDLHKAIGIGHLLKKGTQLFYSILNATDFKPNCCEKWTTKLNTNVNWETCLFKIHKIKDVKLKWLQMRIMHRIIATNVVLSKMGISHSDKCSFCPQEKESIEHVFWKCCHVSQFWEALQKTINEKCLNVFNFKFTLNLILFGADTNMCTDPVLDLVILIAKQYLYRCKMEKSTPRLYSFINHLKQRFLLEEYNAKILWESGRFKNEWHKYKPLIDIET